MDNQQLYQAPYLDRYNKINFTNILQKNYKNIIFVIFFDKMFHFSKNSDIIYVVKIGGLYPKAKEEKYGRSI